MTDSLTSNEKAFVSRMAHSDEEAGWGFEFLLQKRSGDLAKFFDPLLEAELFAPEKNIGPIPSDKEGFVHIPYWPALKYLVAVAKDAGDQNDTQLAEKIMSVMRSVTTLCREENGSRDNYHTFHAFAEILGLLPPTAITLDDLDMVPIWLNSKFDHGLVASALDKGYMHCALASQSPEDWNKACRVLYHCTAIKWVTEQGFGDHEKRRPVSVVEDFWLEKLIKHHANALGTKIGEQSSDDFTDRLKEVFHSEQAMPSYWSRPAIEENDQNLMVEEPGDRFIEGLREVLLHWIDHDAAAAADYVRNMLDDDADIIRRIALHSINHRWTQLREIYFSVPPSRLFCDELLHEHYLLLQSHFRNFDKKEQTKILEAVRNIPSDDREDNERWLKREQRNWLSAIVGQGCESADQLYRDLDIDPSIGRASKYPSLHSYHESWSGPGPSPYSVEQLLKHVRDGNLIKALHAFTEPSGFQGPETPTLRALVDVLIEAVKRYPQTFIRILPDFLDARRPFQYAVIAGFQDLWNQSATNVEQPLDWDETWLALVEFFENLLSNNDFWTERTVEAQNLTPNRDWIPHLIATFLKAGTQSDEHAYPESLLPRMWPVINLLLQNVQAEEDAGDDPMFTAINSSKGKVIEALFNHALRVCRISDQNKEHHVAEWETMRSTFDTELDKCANDNYEMSTLCGAYLANLDYLSHDWLVQNIVKIFPEDYPANFICAMDGMAYSPENRAIYGLLIEKGIIDKAISTELKGRHAREKLIQRIALAYIWGDESLDGPRFSSLFKMNGIRDLEEAGDFFWRVSDQPLTSEQVGKILDFWERCVDWSNSHDEPSASLLSSISKLASYVNRIGVREMKCLSAVAPYVHTGYDADRFIENLERLSEANPIETCEILGLVLDTYKPTFDYEDHLKKLIKKIAAHGDKEKAAAREYANKLANNLPGMYDLFKELKDS